MESYIFLIIFIETGVVIKVPAFMKEGDIVSVDTDTYAYRERKK